MRAQRLHRPASAEERPLRLEDVASSMAAPGEVVIAVEACGVCRTDLHILEGEVPAKMPITLGHQAAGRIVEVGSGVEGLSGGDLVGVGWIAWTCGTCSFCVSGRENLCPRAKFTGRDRDGGYADRLAADARWVYPLPKGFAPRAAAPLLCAGIIGYRSLKVSGIGRGGRIGLFGFGASAHLAMQVARHWGCEVYAFTREPRHRELALSLGATWAGDSDDDPGVPLDAAVLFAPAGPIVPLALARLDRGASLAINAIHMSPIPAMDYSLLYGERGIRSVTNFTRRDAEEFLALAAQIPVRAAVELYPLDAANDALLAVKRGGIRGAAVLTITPPGREAGGGGPKE
jgi:propanol-preferring alcohol dehydrogenase